MKQWIAFAVLIAAVVATAVGVIGLRHESRTLFATLQKAEARRDAARVEWSRLQLEQAWLVESGRIERKAGEALDMRRPDDVHLLVKRP